VVAEVLGELKDSQEKIDGNEDKQGLQAIDPAQNGPKPLNVFLKPGYKLGAVGYAFSSRVVVSLIVPSVVTHAKADFHFNWFGLESRRRLVKKESVAITRRTSLNTIVDPSLNEAT